MPGRLLLLLAALAFAGCTAGMKPPAPDVQIGPFHEFSGRLLVIEPKRRWQVGIDWHADTPDTGQLRLTHAASGMVVELRWEPGAMQLRDSRNPLFRSVTATELREQGIVIPPWTLAAILLDRMPAAFHPTPAGEWESHIDGALIRIHWDADRRRLVLTDITHGRRATLIIGT